MEPALRAAGLSALYLFGSRARGDDRAAADVDLTFEVAAEVNDRFTLWDQAGLLARLTGELQTKVDLVERRALRPRIGERVERDLRRVF